MAVILQIVLRRHIRLSIGDVVVVGDAHDQAQLVFVFPALCP